MGKDFDAGVNTADFPQIADGFSVLLVEDYRAVTGRPIAYITHLAAASRGMCQGVFRKISPIFISRLLKNVSVSDTGIKCFVCNVYIAIEGILFYNRLIAM